MENLNLFTNIDASVKDSKGNINGSANAEVKKEGSSLFDFLLKENVQKLVPESSSINSTIMKKDLLNDTSNGEMLKNISNDITKENSVVSKSIPSNDLLSKLLVDAKTSLDKTSNNIVQDSKINSVTTIEKTPILNTENNDISIKLTDKNNIEVNNATVLKKSTKLNTVSKVKDENINIADVKISDQSSSLLDRLLSNAIQSIKKSDIDNLEESDSKLTLKNVVNKTQQNLVMDENTNSVLKAKDVNVVATVVENIKLNDNSYKLDTNTNIKDVDKNSEESDSKLTLKNVVNKTQQNLDKDQTTHSAVKAKDVNVVATVVENIKLNDNSNKVNTNTNTKDVNSNLVKNLDLPLLESISKEIEITDKNEILEKNLQVIKVSVDTNKLETVQNTQTSLINDDPKTEASIEKPKNEPNILLKDNIETKVLNSLDLSKPDLFKQEVSKIEVPNSNEKLDNKVYIQSNELNTIKSSSDNQLEGIDKNAIVHTEQKIKNISLLDELIKKATIPELNKQNEPVVSENVRNNLLNNIYLGSVKNNVTNQNIINTSTARTILQNATSVQDVKKASDILNLNADNISLDTETKIEAKVDIKQVDLMKVDQKISILDRVLINTQRLENINLLATKITDIVKLDYQAVNTSNSTSNFNDMINKADDVNLSVNQNLANNIQFRIIGARQQLSSMMSDLARTMYENYKPPVTVFKINLNPANLGMISVVMKNERDNSISISMNMSNDSTLEAILDNQNSLRSALNKTFSEQNSSFNLNFGSNENFQNQNNENEFESSFTNTDENNEETSQNNVNIQDDTTYL